MENIGTILGIIGSILSIIGSMGAFKKGSSINVSGIEYSFKSFKQQNRSRTINSILPAFQAIMLIFIYITLYCALYYMERQVFTIEAEMVIPFLIKCGIWHFPAVIFLFYLMLLKNQSKGKKRDFFLIIVLWILDGLILFIEQDKCIWGLIVLGVVKLAVIIYILVRVGRNTYIQVSELSKFYSLLYIGIHVLFFLGFFLLSIGLLNLEMEKFLELVKNSISSEALWIIFFLILMAIFALVRLWYSSFYNKMANIAFIYYQEKDGKKIYIYRKEGNQFLCANKEYLQCERKAFDTKIEEIQSKIEEKDWTDDNKKKELNKYIDRLKPYSNFVRIDKGEGKECIELLEIYVNIFIDIIKVIRKIEDKQNIDSEIEIKLKRLKKCRQLYEENLIGQGKKILREFQEMTAIKFIPEDEVMKQTLYPVVENYQKGFFKKL